MSENNNNFLNAINKNSDKKELITWTEWDKIYKDKNKILSNISNSDKKEDFKLKYTDIEQKFKDNNDYIHKTTTSDLKLFKIALTTKSNNDTKKEFLSTKSNLDPKVKKFINDAFSNKLNNSLLDFNINKFNKKDNLEGLSKYEIDQYFQIIDKALNQIGILWWYDEFKKQYKNINKEPDFLSWKWDIVLANKVDLQEYIFWKWEKHLTENLHNYSEEELHFMREEKFDITDWEKMKNFIVLLWLELWDGIQDILKFLWNMPAGLILLPRYISNRAELTDDKIDNQDEVEAQMENYMLLKDNPSLMLWELLWEKGIAMIKQLWEMFVSWKNGDITMVLVTIAWLIAWWAWLVKLTAKWWKMAWIAMKSSKIVDKALKIEKWASKVQKWADKVDKYINLWLGWSTEVSSVWSDLSKIDDKISKIKLSEKLTSDQKVKKIKKLKEERNLLKNTDEFKNIVKYNANIEDNVIRLNMASRLLWNKKLTKEQSLAIIDAHEVWKWREWATIYNYNQIEIIKKSKTLSLVWFSKEENRILMENWIVWNYSLEFFSKIENKYFTDGKYDDTILINILENEKDWFNFIIDNNLINNIWNDLFLYLIDNWDLWENQIIILAYGDKFSNIDPKNLELLWSDFFSEWNSSWKKIIDKSKLSNELLLKYFNIKKSWKLSLTEVNNILWTNSWFGFDKSKVESIMMHLYKWNIDLANWEKLDNKIFLEFLNNNYHIDFYDWQDLFFQKMEDYFDLWNISSKELINNIGIYSSSSNSWIEKYLEYIYRKENNISEWNFDIDYWDILDDLWMEDIFSNSKNKLINYWFDEKVYIKLFESGWLCFLEFAKKDWFDINLILKQIDVNILDNIIRKNEVNNLFKYLDNTSESILTNDLILKLNEEWYYKYVIELFRKNENVFKNVSSDLLYLLDVASNSPSSELQKIINTFIPSILKSENPKKIIDKLNDIFVKNNLPLVWKIYKVIQAIYPEWRYSDFVKTRWIDNTSPLLFNNKNYERWIFTLYRDTLKNSILSWDSNLKNYLVFLKDGWSLLKSFENGVKLSKENQAKLWLFLTKITTLWDEINIHISKNDSIDNIYSKIKDEFNISNSDELLLKLSESFLKPVWIKSIDQWISIINNVKSNTTNRNLELIKWKTHLTLEKWDMSHWANSSILRLILSWWFKSWDLLWADKVNDLVPFSHNLEEIKWTINEWLIDKLGVSKDYWNIKFITKDRWQFFKSNKLNYKEWYKKENRWKYEQYYWWPRVEEWQILVRSWLPSSEIDFLLLKESDFSQNKLQQVFFEIAKNDMYIPVVNNLWEIIFTIDDFNNYKKVFYWINNNIDYKIIWSNESSIYYKWILEMLPKKEELSFTTNISNWIKLDIYDLLKNDFWIDSYTKINYSDISKAKIDDTWSTWRLTNLSKDFDFDFSLQLSSKDMKNINEIENKILSKYKFDSKEIYNQWWWLQIRMFWVEYNWEKVDIDIFINQRPEIKNLEAHDSITYKLDYVKENYWLEKYNDIIANIRFAKKFFKEWWVYKKWMWEKWQWWLWGIWIETWILQNKWSFDEAIKTFKNISDISNNFNEFKDNYQILWAWDNIKTWGMENFTYNMTEEWYKKMLDLIN